jgi:uncharacterized protein YjbJ (UPF0337 family)
MVASRVRCAPLTPAAELAGSLIVVVMRVAKRRIPDMDKEHVKGAADKAKGAIKDAAGKMTDDKSLQAEGKIDKAKGAAHQAAGDIKDAAKR